MLEVIIEDLSDSALAEYFLVLKERMQKERKELGMIEHALDQRITATGNKAMGTDTHDIRLVRSTRPEYSMIDLRMDLAEHLPPDELAACFNPERTEVIKESVNNREVAKIKSRYGGTVSELIENARRDRMRVQVKRKDEQ